MIDDSTADTTKNITARPSPPSSVSVSPVQDVYGIGDTVTLTCTVITNVPDHRNKAWIRWLKNNAVIIDTEVSPTTVDGIHSINYTYPLTINNITLSDASDYSCRAIIRSDEIPNLIPSTTVRQNIIVDITIPDPNVSISFSPDYSYYHYGEDIMLYCMISYPTNIQSYIDEPTEAMVQWMKDDRLIDSDTVEPINGVYTSNMTLSNIDASDAGIYTCQAVVGSDNINIVDSTKVNVTSDITVISGVDIYLTTSTNVVLDYPGYNMALVQCVYDHDPDVIPDTITWTVSINSSTASDVTDLSVQNGNISTLNITLSDVGTVVITCESDLLYNNDRNRTRPYSNVSTILVKGSVNPEIPEIIEAVNDTSTSVTVSWRVESVSYTPETYTVHYGTNDSGQFESSQTVSGPTQLQEILDINGAVYRVTLTDLKPYTVYYYYVNATNTEGSSNSTLEDLITDEDVPEKVQDLLIDILTSTSVLVQWSEPTVPNGVITSYEVNVFMLADTYRQFMHDDTSLTITLEPYTPYVVSVAGVTSKGRGDIVETEIFFTEEGVPQMSPRNIVVDRINSTVIRVTWEPLTLVEARGFITNYTVIAQPLERRKRVDGSIVRIVPHNVSNITITGLDSSTNYNVTVRVGTVVGQTVSAPVQAPQIEETSREETTSSAVTVAVAVVIVCLVLAIIITVSLIIAVYFIRKRHKSTYSSDTYIPRSHLRMMTKAEESKMTEAKAEEPPPLQDTEMSEYDNVTFRPEQSRLIPKKNFPAYVRGHLVQIGHDYESINNMSPNKPATVAEERTIKNRYKNILPFDDHRVVLSVENGDYINASYIRGYNKDPAYIAAQGPVPQSVEDFWRMIWELRTPTIVMLTKVVENGVRKCEQYWPKHSETKELENHLKIKLLKEFVDCGYETKKLVLSKTSEPDAPPLEITHYLFTEWPDHGVPTDKSCMIAFIKHIRQFHPPEGPPLVVHCSAGVGRTGTFIVLDTMLQRMEQEDKLNVFEFVLSIREQRVKMVQTQSQYMFIHESLADFIEFGITSFTVTNAYATINQLRETNGFQTQFETLKKIKEKPTEEKDYKLSIATAHWDKNRFSYNRPYDHSRVSITTDNTYINASWINSFDNESKFIATQTPLQTTITDFWQMVQNYQCHTVVLLCTLGTAQCPQFLPEQKGSIRSGPFTISFVSMENSDDFNILTIKLTMKNSGSQKVVFYQYLDWPDRGKPKSTHHLLKMMKNVTKNQSSTENKPVVVMCNDGVGRTGAFITIYSQLERAKLEGVADIFQFVRESRRDRAGLIANAEQYEYCYEVIADFTEEMNSYGNFNFNNIA